MWQLWQYWRGGGQATCWAPWSNYATRPPVRPSSLTSATLRTVLISCQVDQLPSFTILHRWTFLQPHHHTPPAVPPCQPAPLNDRWNCISLFKRGAPALCSKCSTQMCARHPGSSTDASDAPVRLKADSSLRAWKDAASPGLYESIWFEMMKRPLQLAGPDSFCLM